MDIATLWIKRKGFEDGPAELLVAWDGWSIEENWEGWRDACDRELKAVGDDVAAKRFVNLSREGRCDRGVVPRVADGRGGARHGS